MSLGLLRQGRRTGIGPNGTGEFSHDLEELGGDADSPAVGRGALATARGLDKQQGEQRGKEHQGDEHEHSAAGAWVAVVAGAVVARGALRTDAARVPV